MDFRALHIVTVLFDVVFFWVDDFVVSAVAKNIECDGFLDFRALHIVTVLFDVVFFWVDDFVVSAVAKNIECDGFAAATAVIDFMYYLFILFRHLPSFLLLFLFLLLLFQI